MSKKKVYAYYILDTNKSGIVFTWEECQNIVKGTKSRYKSFKNENDAIEWIKNGAEYESKNKIKEELFQELDREAIYFDAGTGRGNGVEVKISDFDGNSLMGKILDSSKLNEFGNYYLSEGRTNNYGELVGLFAALKYAEKYKRFTICGDSALVIEYWSKGRYNSENLDEDTISLIKKVTQMRKEFEMKKGKVEKISGDVNPADLGFHK